MRNLLERCLRSGTVLALVICACAPRARTQTVTVRYQQGTMRGFLELHSADKRLLASGEFTQVAHGDEVTTQTVFRFKDGSLDDETTVFSQRRRFQLISDHHIQKGPFFPHPIDSLIDARKGQVTVRSPGKNGKDESKTQHMDLPADLANGMLPVIIENLPSNAPETTVSMLVFMPDPRLVKMEISPVGEARYWIGDASRPATRFQVKIDIGGVTGVLAHLAGKQPPDLHFWIVGSPAPTFLKEQGQSFPEGPILTVDLVGPAWPE